MSQHQDTSEMRHSPEEVKADKLRCSGALCLRRAPVSNTSSQSWSSCEERRRYAMSSGVPRSRLKFHLDWVTTHTHSPSLPASSHSSSLPGLWPLPCPSVPLLMCSPDRYFSYVLSWFPSRTKKRYCSSSFTFSLRLILQLVVISHTLTCATAADKSDAKLSDLIDTLMTIREAILKPSSTDLELVKSIKEIKDAIVSAPSPARGGPCQDNSAFNRLMQQTVRIAAGQMESLQLRLKSVEIDVNEAKEAAIKAEASVLAAKNEAERARTAAREARATAQEAKEVASQAKSYLAGGHQVTHRDPAEPEDQPEETKGGSEQTTMEQVQRLAQEAKDLATGAQNTAEEAQNTAEEALGVAKEAQIFSVEATLAAEDAHNTAKEAMDSAGAAHITAEEAHNATKEVHFTAMEAMASSREVKDTIEEAKTIASTTLKRITEEMARTRSGDPGIEEDNEYEIEEVKEIASEAQKRAQKVERMCQESVSEVKERTRKVEGMFTDLTLELEGRFIKAEEACEDVRGEVGYRVTKVEESCEKVKDEVQDEVEETKALARRAKDETQDVRKTVAEAKGVAELAKRKAVTAEETAKKAEKDAKQALLVSQGMENHIQRVEAIAKVSEGQARKAKLTALRAEASSRKAEITASKAETMAKQLEKSCLENTTSPPWPEYDYDFGDTFKFPEFEYESVFEDDSTTIRTPQPSTKEPASALRTTTQATPTSHSPACPPSFSHIGTDCLSVSKLYRNWNEARLICQSLWGDLIVHRTTIALQELLLAHGVYKVWLGAFMDADEDNFYWLDDERVTAPSKVPLLTKNKPICLSMVWDGQGWHNEGHHCLDQLHYVCQAKVDSK
ncbi:uncharacterized protein LOC143033591 [Oratosquilla oratoria]|uniref:uncharacterized protein LOC143033591 n=1 Tax=Oratosquilla oratoria TaxID=337810 RepID=UPI003F76CA94